MTPREAIAKLRRAAPFFDTELPTCLDTLHALLDVAAEADRLLPTMALRRVDTSALETKLATVVHSVQRTQP